MGCNYIYFILFYINIEVCCRQLFHRSV